MAFEDVCEMEPVRGDDGYTAWLAAGRPVLDGRDTPSDQQKGLNAWRGR